MRTAVLSWILIVSLTGCSEPIEPPVVIRTDSSGVEIVTTTTSGEDPSSVWRLSRRPQLEIGDFDGPEEVTFGNIRSVGRLPDGRIFVGDEQAHAGRVFSANGSYEGSFGGEGEGPGELQWFLKVAPYRGDSIFVYDYRLRAISVFDSDLSFGRRSPNPILVGNYWITGSLPDGRFLATSPGRNIFRGESGVFADSSHVILVAPDGRAADTVAAYRVTIQHLDSDGRTQPSFLQPHGRAIVFGDQFAWVEGEQVEVVIASQIGLPTRVARKLAEPTPLTSELRREFRTSFLEGMGQNPEEPMERIRRMLDEGHYPEVLPMVSPELHADALGFIWVSRYHFEGEVASEWEVFDSTGAWVGLMETPENFRVHQIGTDEIVGVGLGDYGVPFVHVYGLTRE